MGNERKASTREIRNGGLIFHEMKKKIIDTRLREELFNNNVRERIGYVYASYRFFRRLSFDTIQIDVVCLCFSSSIFWLSKLCHLTSVSPFFSRVPC